MPFTNVIGHSEIISVLSVSLEKAKTGHAYLFIGPAGVGKKTLAKSFAGALLCSGDKDIDTCGCPSCNQFRLDSHPDFIRITPTGNSIKIEQLRELQRNAYFKPLMGEHKIFFLPEAELLTEAAANSFLKLLEEPPNGVVFLFTAVRSDNILPTIRSRCQILNLFPVSTGEIEDWLIKKGVSKEEAVKRSIASQGLPGKAAGDETHEHENLNLSHILQMTLLKQLKVANEFEKRDRREALELLQEWESETRTTLLQVREKLSREFTTGELNRLIFILEKLVKIKNMIENNVNVRLAVEEFFLAIHINN